MKDVMKQYGLPDSSKVIKGTESDARYLESGMIEDKNKGEMYVVVGGKVVRKFPIMTGLNKNGEVNNKDVAWMNAHPEEAKSMRATPRGTYLSTPTTIYGEPGFNMNPIPAFGEPAPQATNLAQHVIYPGEYDKRMKIMKGPGEKRVGSWGCTNMYGQDIDCLTGEIFPKGDTTIVVDSRVPKDQAFLKNKYNIQKMGGQPCYNCGGMYDQGGMAPDGRALVNAYSHGGAYGNVPQHGRPQGPDDGTYYQGSYFDDGGSFIPTYGDSAYSLPQYDMGSSFAFGGSNDCPPGYVWEPKFNTCVPINIPSPSIMEQMVPQGRIPGPHELTHDSIPMVPSTQRIPNNIPPAHERSHAGSYQDGGSTLYSTQGQTLRNFTNTLANSSGWSPSHTVLPNVGPNNRGNGSRTPAGLPNLGRGLTIPMNFDDGGMTPPEQQGGGMDPQQLMQQVAQALQQGIQPEQIMQQLVQMGIPQDQAQQIIQQVMQQMQGGQQESSQGQEVLEGQPMQKYGGDIGRNSKFAVGGEYDVDDQDVQKLISQGYKIQYV